MTYVPFNADTLRQANALPSEPPLLSIIIPTRDRLVYARSAIRNVLEIPSPELELVVQDNSSTEELDAFVASLQDPRLRYRRVREPLDMVSNFERGAELASGVYVTFIGDDDGVHSEIVDAVRWAQSRNLDAILPTRPVHYWWPDFSARYHGSLFSGTLSLALFTGHVSFPSPEKELHKCVRSAGSFFYDLPKLYYGIVRKNVLEKIHQRAGAYFPGPSPDMAGAVAAACSIRTMAKVDYPLFIPGSSAAGCAGRVVRGTHEGELEDQPHLPRRYVEGWSSLVPRFWNGPTTWGEDVVQALRAMGRSDLLQEFNYARLHAACAVFSPRFIGRTLRNLPIAARAVGENTPTAIACFAAEYVKIWGERAMSLKANIRTRLAPNASGQPLFIKGLPDIAAAARMVATRLVDNGVSFSCLVEQ